MAEERAKRIREETTFVLDAAGQGGRGAAAARGGAGGRRPGRADGEEVARRGRSAAHGRHLRDGRRRTRAVARRRGARPDGGHRAAPSRGVTRAPCSGSASTAAPSQALGQEIGDLAALWTSSAELRQALENPVFRPSEKRAVLEQLLPRVAPTRRGAPAGAAAAGAPPHPAPAGHRPRLPRPGRRAHRAGSRQGDLRRAAGARRARAGAPLAGRSGPARR